MASANLRDELSCSICLNIYKDPVTLKCGHNFCLDCINSVLDTQEGSGVYNCPQCREQFQKRSAWKKNTTLCNILESLHLTQSEQEETGIFCTYCIHSPVPAAQCCLLCEAFLCLDHVKVHNNSAEHILTEPSTLLKIIKCPTHKKVFEYYCMDDATCICVYCSVGEHRRHQVVKLEEAAEKKRDELIQVLENLSNRREKIEDKISKLNKLRKSEQKKAVDEMERVASLFRDIKRQLEDLEDKVMDVMSKREEQVLFSLRERIQRLERMKDVLSTDIDEIQELCTTTDPVIVLENSDIIDCYDSEDDDGGSEETVIDQSGPDKSQISEMLNQGLSIITSLLTKIGVQNTVEIFLDVDSAANNIIISSDLRTALWTEMTQKWPARPKRFDGYQVLATVSFSEGQHFWDVEVSQFGGWTIGVCYPSMDRTGEQSGIGNNEKSWGLCSRYNSHQYTVIHNKNEITLPAKVSCDRVRVYLDYDSGQLSFYELCERHIYTFNATFTEPLYAVFGLFRDSITILEGQFVSA